MIILVGGKKGGSGKSSLAVHLALGALAQVGKKGDVLLADCDPQATASDWLERRKMLHPDKPCPASLKVSAGDFKHVLQGSVERYAHTIIDTPGGDNEEFLLGLSVADVAVLPMRTTAVDLATLQALDRTVGAAKLSAPQLKRCLVVLTQTPTLKTQGSIEEDARAAIRGVAKHVTVAKQSMGYRLQYQEAGNEGLSALELPGRPAIIQTELINIWGEVLTAGGQRWQKQRQTGSARS